jgi:hypothetical protein
MNSFKDKKETVDLLLLELGEGVSGTESKLSLPDVGRYEKQDQDNKYGAAPRSQIRIRTGVNRSSSNSNSSSTGVSSSSSSTGVSSSSQITVEGGRHTVFGSGSGSGSGSDSDGDSSSDTDKVSARDKLLHLDMDSVEYDAGPTLTRAKLFSSPLMTTERESPDTTKAHLVNRRWWVFFIAYVHVLLVVVLLVGVYLYKKNSSVLGLLSKHQSANGTPFWSTETGVQVLSHALQSPDTFDLLDSGATMPRYILLEYSDPGLSSNSSYYSYRLSLYIRSRYVALDGVVVLACSDGSLAVVVRRGAADSDASSVVVVTPPGHPHLLYSGANRTAVPGLLRDWTRDLAKVTPANLNFELYSRFPNMTALLKGYHLLATKDSLLMTKSHLLYYSV